MQRYFVDHKQITDQTIIITDRDDLHHITKVMRNRPGTQLVCVDGAGFDYVVEITHLDKDAVNCRRLSVTPSRGEPAVSVTLAQALPKGERWDWVLQKGTELGVTRFLPFVSERTVVKIGAGKAEKKRARWQRIVKEAAEQSERGIIPAVSMPRTWRELLATIAQTETAWLAYERGGRPLREVLTSLAPQREMLLIVGPEGGFTPSEIEAAVGVGAELVTLGSRILRAETAPLVALSCILYATDELGGENDE